MSLEHQLPTFLMKESQMSGERAQCGLTSLLPMSCRGSAEAFARSLRTRLRDLGGPADADTRWLGADPPARRDSQLFFDFELECESPSSPVDECDAPFRDRSPSDEPDAPFYEARQEPDRDQSPKSDAPVNGDRSPPRPNGFTFSSAFYTDRSPIKTQPTPRENGHEGRLYAAIAFDDCERHEQSLKSSDEPDAGARLSPPTPRLAREPSDSDSEFESAKSDLTDAAELESPAALPTDRLRDLSPQLEDSRAQSDRVDPAPLVIDSPSETNDISSSKIEENALVPEQRIENVESENEPMLPDDRAAAEADRESPAEPETEEEDRPQRVRRCSSLKTGKTPPGTPGRKKIVRFADVLGLDLADVKTFMDEIPVIPKSAYSDLADADVAFGSPPTRSFAQRSGSPGALSLVPLFQPARDLTEALEARCVCLESARAAEGPHVTVCGSVRVRNLDFHKTVHVRYSLDGWRTYTDVQATYVPGSCDGFSDRFTFLLYVVAVSAGQRLELAVRFQCKGVQYWDNNFGMNYCFDCLPLGVPSVASVGSSPLHPTRDWHPSFY